jgi:RHS repeat-associated protein
VADESGLSTLRAFDGYDRTARAAADPVGLAAGSTGYTSNAVDELTAITDPLGHTVTKQLDPRGDLVGLTDPDRGNSTTIYDRTGHIKQYFPQTGGDTTNSYDAIGRQKMSELVSGRIVNWLYDEPNHGFSAGQLTAITDSYGIGCPFRQGVPGGYVVDERSYDLAGRVTSRTLCVDGENKTFGFEYDAMSRQSAITYPDGEHVMYHYNNAGQLSKIDGYVTTTDYDAAGRITRIAYANGTAETYTYDPKREWLNVHRVLRGNTMLSETTYHYYDNGQLKSQDTSGGASSSSTYTYDGAGRLTDVSGTAANHYIYDAAGDPTQGPDGRYYYDNPDPTRNRCGGAGGNTCPHAVKRIGTGSEVTYNLRGEATEITRTNGAQLDRSQIGWDADGNPVTFTSNGTKVATVGYDVDGRRTSVTKGPQTTHSFGGYLDVTRATPTSTPEETKSYFAGTTAFAHATSGTVTYDHLDTLGSTQLVTDGSGAVQAGYTHDAYGQLVATTGTSSDRQYAGGLPVELGLIDMGARLYDPRLGRFLSPDPQLPDASAPRPVDPYSYANGDPVNLIDPQGTSATRGFSFGALGAGTSPSGQPAQLASLSQNDLNTINAWIGRSDPSAASATCATPGRGSCPGR